MDDVTAGIQLHLGAPATPRQDQQQPQVGSPAPEALWLQDLQHPLDHQRGKLVGHLSAVEQVEPQRQLGIAQKVQGLSQPSATLR